MRFDFKQFTIQQDRCAMKVGTDGVLLGCCVSIEGHETQVLDIGTGTGLIALMVAQRLAEAGNTTFHIDGVEIDTEAAEQAAGNCKASPWSRHLQVHPLSLSAFAETQVGSYSLIVSNPPFYNATLKPEDEARAVARHKDALPLQQIMRFASQHLTPEGRLSLIYPAEYDTEVMTAALLAQLRPQRIVRIFTKVGKPCKRLITEFVRQESLPCPTLSEELYLRDADSQYSESYRTITSPFYLHLK